MTIEESLAELEKMNKELDGINGALKEAVDRAIRWKKYLLYVISNGEVVK